MDGNFETLKDKRINRIYLPGTHDSVPMMYISVHTLLKV